MTLREQIIEEAEGWLNTPYQHFQRCKRAGVDCVQFVAGVCENVGLTGNIITPYYSPQWHLHQHEELLRDGILGYGCTWKNIQLLQPGDLLLFRFSPTQPCSHSAIYLPKNKMIHALAATPRKVKIHGFTHEWRKKWFDSCYNFPGVV